MNRFIPAKRTALDGKVWWVVYDKKRNGYATFLCFGKYKTKSDCVFTINHYSPIKLQSL